MLDELLCQDIEKDSSLENNQLPPPIRCFQKYFTEWKPTKDHDDKESPLNTAAVACLRDMYHYARVSGLHILDCIMNTALSAIKREQLQEAAIVC